MKPALVFSFDSQCSGKRGYRHRREAKRALKHAQTNGHHGITIYRCPWCYMHHLGTDRERNQS